MDRESIVKVRCLLAETECHWVKVASGVEPGNAANCPLCKKYPRCNNCPIYLETGNRNCHGTPWYSWIKLADKCMTTTPKAKVAADEMTAFIAQLEEKWVAKLEEFDREAAKEVFVWLLKDGELRKMRVYCPINMDAYLDRGGHYHLDTLSSTIHAIDEGSTWFRSEEAALEALNLAKAEARKAQKETMIAARKWDSEHIFAKDREAEAPDCLISLREAKEWIERIRTSFDNADPCSPPLSVSVRVGVALDAVVYQLDHLPHHPIPGDKMVPLKAVEEWLAENGYSFCSNHIGRDLLLDKD